MAWFWLVLAGIFEVVWAYGLKYADGFSRLWPSLGIIVAMIISVVLLEFALRSLPLGTAYAIWTGIGILGTTALGIAFMGEPAGLLRLLCIGLIVVGVIGLKLITPE
jgi:quaternary ammonium compound-resistance protein SugE